MTAGHEQSSLQLGAVTPDASGFEALRLECEAQGHRMLTRFAENWRHGRNRFNRASEIAVGAYNEQTLIGLCGRNLDPYDSNPRAGRVRHLYVAARFRHRGIGRLLLGRVIDGADQWFDNIITNCPPEAAPFYEHLGFRPISADRITHRLMLR